MKTGARGIKVVIWKLLNMQSKTAQIDPNAFGLSLAVVSALIMLLLGILGNLGLYTGAVEAMRSWHILFSLSFVGVIGGMIEAAVISYIFGLLIATTYNHFAKGK